MKASVEQVKPNVSRIVLDGRLDASGSGSVEAAFNAAVAGASNAIVDLTRVSFIASTGLRLLVAGSQDIAKRGGRMVLVGPDDMTRRTLKTTGLDQLMQVHGSVADAIAAF